MANMTRLEEIIRADFKEDNVQFNVQKFLESDFVDRLFDFAEEYEEVRDIKVLDSIKSWLSKKDYDYIKYFLNTTCIEYSLSALDMQSIISMSYEEFKALQEKYLKIYKVLNQKKALYKEFCSFYE